MNPDNEEDEIIVCDEIFIFPEDFSQTAKTFGEINVVKECENCKTITFMYLKDFDKWKCSECEEKSNNES